MLDYVGNLREIESRLPSFMEDDPQTGRFRVARDIFTDPDLFELEMKHIWEGNWIYLAHETQIPNKNDYFTMYMGRVSGFTSPMKPRFPTRTTTSRCTWVGSPFSSPAIATAS